MNLRLKLLPALLLAAAAPAQAGSVTDLGLSMEQIRELNAQLTAPVAAPGIAFGSATAFGAGWGQAFAGLGGQTLTNAEEDVDGSAVIGFGMGDPRRFFGIETAINIISLQEGLAEDGNWNFKLHRTFASRRAAFAIGVEDTSGWGAAKDRHSSSYAAYTQAVDLSPEAPKRPMTLAYTLGVGGERFADPEDDYGAFGSVALAWHRQASAILDWDGRDLNVGASVVPFYRIPLVVTAGFINLTERFENAEFAAGAGYLYQF